MSGSRVLLTDGETRACLAAARGLAADGFEVIAAAAAGHVAAAHWSRQVSRRVRTPDPLTDEPGSSAALLDTVPGGDVDVLMPGSDASLVDISRARASPEPVMRIGLPAVEPISFAF